MDRFKVFIFCEDPIPFWVRASGLLQVLFESSEPNEYKEKVEAQKAFF